MAEFSQQPDSIEITFPDDWHHHFRDGDVLPETVRHCATRFSRAIAMPNLKPPVVNTEDALAYRERILAHVPEGATFEPLMTLYLTDRTTPEEIRKAKESGCVYAVKLYPAGATTNSDSGVTDIELVYPALEAMAEVGLILCVHGEVTAQAVDVFDREPAYIEEVLRPLVARFPTLKVVMEHITTSEAVDFVLGCPPNVAATITAHHLLYNRNAIFQGGIRPHMYCLPILKRETHRQALMSAALSAAENKKFFAGTDSAPHAISAKEAECGCAGVFTGHAAVELYAEAFLAADGGGGGAGGGGAGAHPLLLPVRSVHPETELGLGVSLRKFARMKVCSSVATEESLEIPGDHVETCTVASTDVHPPSSIGGASEHGDTASLGALTTPPHSPACSL